MNARASGRPIPLPAVLVIGDVMLDVIATPERSIEYATDTPAKIALVPGGSGANLAAWLGHFGNRVRFAGRVGHAAYAEHAAAFRAHGVEERLAIDERNRTGVLVTLIGAAGERSFLTDPGANACLERADLADELLDDVALVHVSGYTLFRPAPRAAVRAFLAVAVNRGIAISVDCGSVALLRDVGPAAFLAWTNGAALCFANAVEATLLAGSAERKEQLLRLGAHYETLVITCGSAGAVAATERGTRYWSTAAPAADAIDTTGAGDAFVAAFLSARLRGDPIAVCLERGAQAGATAVGRVGGRPTAVT